MGSLAHNTASALSWPQMRLSAKGLLGYLARLDATYRQRRALASLDDRLLEDIGLTRADVVRETRRSMLW